MGLKYSPEYSYRILYGSLKYPPEYSYRILYGFQISTKLFL
jgi:hypothetical protein